MPSGTGTMERFLVLADALRLHVWRLRPDGSVSYCNERLIDYTGLTADELQQGGWAALHPDDVARVRAAWDQARLNATPYEVQERVRGRDGRYRWFLRRAVSVLDARGEIVEWLGTDTDIDGREHVDLAVRETVRRLVRDSDQHEAALVKVFEQQTGASLHEFLVRARLHHAAVLIEHGEKIEAVALEMGYRSKKNFYYQFRRVFGMTPGAYRQHPTRCGVSSTASRDRADAGSAPAPQRPRI
jgi:PAS domain S-box-containing protein